jgi:hypothetical protein
VSIYDHRDKSAYGSFSSEPGYALNPHILKWWAPSHDNLLSILIANKQWIWHWYVKDEIEKITRSEIIEAWRREDPICLRYAWYNVLMYFAASRAEQLGLTRNIRFPQWVTCRLCSEKFVEDSLPLPLIERLGIENIQFCSPCLRDTVLQGTGNPSSSKKEIKKYIQDLTNFLERIPPQNFGENIGDLWDLNAIERLALLRLLRTKPSIGRVLTVFGSWLKALIAASVLESGVRETSRGIRCLAKDGHECLSLGEKTIDDFLSGHGLLHDREPHYPEGNYRADFSVGATFVEYFGLSGDQDYDAKTKAKIFLCSKHKITLVAIYPADLTSRKRLQDKLSKVLGSQ